ncbi:GDSL-type esterase/lipase family protein [Enterobacter oligotrophicus]
MTVSTVVDHNDYTGNGVTTSFPYTFRIFDKSDLEVSVLDLSENLTVLVLDTDYTVTNAGGYSGGNVVLSSPLTNGWKISIARSLEATQETDLRNQGKFFAEVHEDAFDKLTMLIQQGFSMFRLALRKPTSIANWYDALGNYIRNLRDPRDPQDAATKNYVDSLATTNFNRTLRVPEAFVNQVPTVAGRMNKVLAFDAGGQPVAVLAADGTATDVMIELGNDDGFKYIGACESMAELRAIAPSFDGQQILLKGYYADVKYDEVVIYVWDASSTATDDGGRFIKPNSLTTGRWGLKHNSNTFDIRLFGARPNPTYSASQMDIQDIVRKAQASLSYYSILHFPLPNGWSEAHYLVDYLGFVYTPTFISADLNVTLHSPFTSDNYGDKPRLASQITFSEIAPSNVAGNGTIQQRDANNYALMDAVGAAMGAPYATMLDRFERLFFTTGSRGIRISNLASNGVAADATGMTFGTQSVLWSNAAAAGSDWQGIEMGCSCGSEVDLILRNTSTAGSGTIIIGARMLNNYGTSGAVLNYRFTIGSDGVSIYNGDTLARNYTTWHPEDQIQSNNGSIRVGLRIASDGKGIQLILNGNPYPVVTSTNTARSIVVLANQAARASTQFQYAHLRSRDAVPYAKGIKITTLGDSITVGARSSNEWPSIIANCAEHVPGLGKLSVDNHYSVSGLRLNTVVQNIANYDFIGQDYVLVALGVNDCQATGYAGIGVFATNIATLGEKIKADGAIPIFGLPYRFVTKSITGGGGEPVNMQDIPLFQQVMRERCAANGYILAEVGDSFGNNAGVPGGFSAAGFMNSWTHDNLHANTRGQLAIASAFASALSRSLSNVAPGCMTQTLTLSGTFTQASEAIVGLLRCTRRGNTVHIVGSIGGGSASQVVATLPSWAAPAQSFNTVAYASGTTNGIARIEVRQSGDIVTGSDYLAGRTDINISFNV